jgi:hypothetical protein
MRRGTVAYARRVYLEGTPQAAGSYTLTFTVQDSVYQQTQSASDEAQVQLNLTIEPAQSLAITTTSLPDAEVGQCYTTPGYPCTDGTSKEPVTRQATGGLAPYTWQLELPPPRARTVVLSPGATRTVHGLPPPLPAAARPHRPPFLPRDAVALARAKEHAVAEVGAPVAPLVLSGTTGSGSGGPSGGTAAGPGLPLMSLDAQVAAFGTGEELVPPDTQLAAGPEDLLEVVNATASVWTKAGAPVTAFDLNPFLGVPAVDAGLGAFDPRVLYDAMAGRWILTASATDPTNTYNQVFLAVSQTSDPTGAWYVYTIEENASGVLYDQPMVGVSDDKVVVSWNDFAYGYFLGEETWVLDAAQLLQGQAADGVVFGPDDLRFRLVPAQDLSSTDTVYLVYNDSDPLDLVQNTSYPALGVVAITGDPAAGDVRWTEWDPAIAPTAPPPDAVQPAGAPLITTDDDRLLSAVWQDGTLWTAGNDACQPQGASGPQPCLRLLEVGTTDGAAVLQDFDAGAPGLALYYPAVGLDAQGDLFVALSWSSATQYASVGATGQLAGAPTGTLAPLVPVMPGQGVYCGFDGSSGAGTNRWGDYSAAAQDPTDPAEVWVAGEYAASASDPGDWGTAAAGLTASEA